MGNDNKVPEQPSAEKKGGPDVPHEWNVEPIDFSDRKFYWIFRRFLIGLLLVGYTLYAIAFAIVVLAQGEKYSDFVKLPATIQHLILMATFGLAGSLYNVTRVFIRTVHKRDFSFSWYITRPTQGILLAVFTYFAFRAGEFVFYNPATEASEIFTAPDLNVYTLSVLAILTGLFSDQAYDKLHSIVTRGRKWRTRSQ